MAVTQAKGRQIAPLDLTTEVAGVLPVANGGTGLAAPGSNGNVLTSNGTAWTSAAPTGGGGGGVVTKQDFTNKATSSETETTPSAGTSTIFTVKQANRSGLKILGESGEDFTLQASISTQQVTLWTPTTATQGNWINSNGNGYGTYTVVTPASTSLANSIRAGQYANVVNTLNQVLGVDSTPMIFWRGNVARAGGFTFFARFGLGAWALGGKLFVGLGNNTTNVSGVPSNAQNMCAFTVDNLETAISFTTNAALATGTKTAIAGQPALAAGNWYDAHIYAPPNGSYIGYRLVNVITGAVIADGTVTTNLPTATSFFSPRVYASNGTSTPVGSVSIRVSKVYVESDI